jgi:hypothetical protein
MRLFFAIIIIALSSATGFGQEAEFSIKQAVHKFPKSTEGTILEHTFTFTNTGKAPLIISDYNVECPCTKLEIPKNPILPGQTGTIKVIFDSSGKSYYQDRIIFLNTNTKRKTEKLRIKVFIEPKS